MYEDTKVSQLVINQLSEEKFKELLENNELDQNQLYMTDDRAGYTPPLLSTLWSDHTINDISWLCADTFSWQSGDVYVAAYNHLVTDFEGTTAETETIGNIEITFYRAEDGHKICLPDQEDNILALYEATGVAWYYILDTENQQFKLPRTQYGFIGLRDEVGGYVEAGLPNITGGFSAQVVRQNIGSSWGAFDRSNTGVGYHGGSDQGNFAGSVNFDASNSNSIYGNSDTVQPKATQMYLYFYVGNFERDAIEQTAGVTTETLNGKADLDLSNITVSAMSMLFTAMLPDYSAGVSMPANATHTATENGWAYFYQFNNGDRWFYIDDNQFHLGAGNGGAQYSGSAILVPISKGQTFMGNGTIIFFPCKGVN